MKHDFLGEDTSNQIRYRLIQHGQLLTLWYSVIMIEKGKIPMGPRTFPFILLERTKTL